MSSKVVGVLGGGQLGRMLQQPASRMGIELVFLDPDANSPAKQISASGKHVQGLFTDQAAIYELAGKCDVLTVEIEHVNTDALIRLEKEGRVSIFPRPEDIALIKDKYMQKERLKITIGKNAVAEQYSVESIENDLHRIGTILQYPYVLKSRTDAYDGRGNFVMRSASDANEALHVLAGKPLYAEKMVNFVRELAVMVLRTQSGDVYSYPCVETVHEHNICKIVYAPASVDLDIAKRAKRIAESAIRDTFSGAGIYGVELFHLADGSIILNEIAPRPHNSGHYTIEACSISQYEAHLRAILNLPLPHYFTRQNSPAIMYNLLGAEDPLHVSRMCSHALKIQRASIHLYGKKESRPQRKMGHITITGSTMAEASHSLQRLLSLESGSKNSVDPVVQVAVIMGSDSDGPSMQDCCTILEEFGISYEKQVVSAHRTPDKMYSYAKDARSRGIQVIIAAAGGAAHLPGMIAALTSLPVIGVPINATCLDGMDSLLSQVQMPRGVPVATVAIGNSTNAALLAIRILGVADADRLRQIEDKMFRNMKLVNQKNDSFMVRVEGIDPFELDM